MLNIRVVSTEFLMVQLRCEAQLLTTLDITEQTAWIKTLASKAWSNLHIKGIWKMAEKW